jgi:hypothetical protein
VLSARVPEDFYEEVKAAAKASGRTMSEELVFRARQTFIVNLTSVPSDHFIAHDGRVTPYPSDPDEPIARTRDIRETMRAKGFTQIPDFLGAYWIEPGQTATALEELLAKLIEQAVEKVLVKMKLAEVKENKSG